ncbi:lantibiotic dehydratase [Frankia sp. Cj3]|uniref:lantibiotic dehydratase n=1 Tax=Frankia sp. Cj3 TaxID=2880976 RepID=UPI001EF44807|nr:lantibiotic dehydratase [Frankia sp. Cj3]
MRARQGSRPYRNADTALVRATAHPGELVLPPWPGMDGAAGLEQWCAWLDRVWAQAPVAAAITVASPVLAARVQAVCSGQRPTAGQVRRMVLAVARYVLRMSGRATPFGVFAGVAAARFGQDVTACWNAHPHTVVTRADAIWLAGVIATLESCTELLHRLPIVVNDLAVVRGDRVVVLGQPHAADPARSVSAEVSVRSSRAVQIVLSAARSPIRGGDLLGMIAVEFPGAPASVIESMVAELVTRGVLITGLRPPSTSTDGLAHVLNRLDEAEAATLGAVAPLADDLRVIQAELETASTAPDCTDGRSRRAVSDRMRAVSGGVEQPLMVDLRLGCTVVLPPQVAAEAEAAAGALLRLTPHPAGTPAWRNYHDRFLDRYGAAVLVPVTDLVDPTIGLGFPAGYRSGRPAGVPGLTERDERLLALAQQAALDGAHEVVLDDTTIGALVPDGCAERADRSPHLEVCAEVRAATMAALTHGVFTLAVTGVSRTAAALTGRFLDVLPEPDREPMARLYGRLPVGVDGALPAQLSFPPLHPRTENVARSPSLFPAVISLAEHRDAGPGRLLLEDLAVTADPDRLYLVSLAQRQVIEPLVAHAAALDAMPPLARFLFELPRARTAVVTPWSWGAAARLPFLPRIRYGRAILVPARWRIPAGELPGLKTPWSEWVAAMAALRRRRRLPTIVYAGDADRRLRLNLDEPMDLAVLRAHLDGAAGAATVSEAPAPSDHGWCAGRAHEVVIPLVSTARPTHPPSVVSICGPLPLIGRDHGRLPGSQVLFAKLYGQPDLHDTILTDHLLALVSAWEETPRWWFVRYRDPDPHLRLRVHLPTADGYGHAASRVGAWAADLRRRGLIGSLTLDTYHPETGRYGTGPALAAAEAVFAADSAAALTQLTARPSSGVHALAVTAASLVDMAAALTGGVPSGMRWLIDHPGLGHPAVSGDRMLRAQAVALADPSGDHAALHAIPGGPRIAAAWHARRTALAAYADRLQDPGGVVEPRSVLGSLLHLHHVRAHGIDRASERLCHRLARAAALAWTAHHLAGDRR